MKISRETLHQLIENKLCQAGLKREHAATVAEVLVYADARGIHSHGAVRVEYYAERISKGGTGNDSNLLIVFYVQIMPDDFVMQLHRF
nr:Ldh family oxidoreductase [Escherichia coli]